MQLQNLLTQLELGSNYEKLFTPQGGYLFASGNSGWYIRPQLKNDEKKGYFEQLVQALVERQSPLDQPIVLAKRINQEWTKKRAEPLPSTGKKVEKGEIRFRSGNSNYSWLSNFFPTLVVHQLNSKEKSYIFYCSETVYVAQTLNDLGYELKAKKAVRTIQPFHAKKLRNQTVRKKDLSDSVRLKIMKQLVREKFAQNPVLRKRLLATGSRELIEDTNSQYWGNKDGKGFNHLGKILMEVRGDLSTPSDPKPKPKPRPKSKS